MFTVQTRSPVLTLAKSKFPLLAVGMTRSSRSSSEQVMLCGCELFGPDPNKSKGMHYMYPRNLYCQVLPAQAGCGQQIHFAKSVCKGAPSSR